MAPKILNLPKIRRTMVRQKSAGKNLASQKTAEKLD